MTVTSNYVDNIKELLDRDMVAVPKEIVCAEVYEESKLMFAVLFTAAAEELRNEKMLIYKLKQHMKFMLAEMSDYDVRAECCCSASKVGIVRHEVKELIDTVDMRRCLNESEDNNELRS